MSKSMSNREMSQYEEDVTFERDQFKKERDELEAKLESVEAQAAVLRQYLTNISVYTHRELMCSDDSECPHCLIQNEIDNSNNTTTAGYKALKVIKSARDYSGSKSVMNFIILEDALKELDGLK